MVANATLRYPGEWFNIIIGAILGSILFVFLSIITGGLCCLWGLLGLIMILLMAAVANNHLRTMRDPVSEESDPGLFSIINEAGENLEMRLPPVLLDPSPDVNAHARGIFSPVVVLNTGLLKIMNDGELKFVIGHEMGHIRLYHSTIRTLFDPKQISVPLIAYIPILVFRVLFLNGRLSRSFEHSADRAGLIACTSLDDAVSCMIKLKTGKSKVDGKTVQQAIKGRMDLDEDDNFLADLLSSHPDFEDRIKEIVNYSISQGI